MNAAFAPAMTEDMDAGQTMYSPLAGGAEPIAGQPSIIALPAPQPTDLPAHFVDDYSNRARSILAQFDLQWDALWRSR